MASDTEVAVFTDTNLGTHLAMATSPDTTVGDFQRELERSHCSCFPKLGEIKVYGVMVKRKSCFYHLPSSMPIKYAFQHQKGAWFLQIEARTIKDSDAACLSNFAAIKVGEHKCDENYIASSLVQNGHLLNCSGVSKCGSSPSTGKAIQGQSEEQLRTKVENCCSSLQNGASPPFIVRTPPKQSSFMSPAGQTTQTPRYKFIRSEVGKRVITALNNIRVSDKQRTVTPLSKIRDGKLLCYKSLSPAKFLVFEISDSDD
ncbi:hypothetical protein PTKIN_Ptkin14bG0010100 [Pterospermum kingtungense]